jgi:hypothetical protein
LSEWHCSHSAHWLRHHWNSHLVDRDHLEEDGWVRLLLLLLLLIRLLLRLLLSRLLSRLLNRLLSRLLRRPLRRAAAL